MFNADGQTDMKRIVVFRNFANAPKNVHSIKLLPRSFHYCAPGVCPVSVCVCGLLYVLSFTAPPPDKSHDLGRGKREMSILKQSRQRF
jgi:hypothetical protein